MEVLLQTYYIVLPIITTAAMSWIGVMLNKQQKERSANSKGTMLILFYMLERYHFEFTSQGFVTNQQYTTFEELYKAYHDLGGNGYGTHMWEDIKKLTIRNDVQGMVSPFAALYKNITEEKRK